MNAILSMIQRVTIFVLAATLLTNLFAGTEYKKYFQYATGLIVIALVISPIVSFFSDDADISQWVSQAVLDQRAEQTEEEMRMLGEKYEKSVEEKYVRMLRQDVAVQCGTDEEHCQIEQRDNRIERITVQLDHTPENITSLVQTLSLRYGVDGDDIFILCEDKE